MTKCSNIPFPNIKHVLYKLISPQTKSRQTEGKTEMKRGRQRVGGVLKGVGQLCNYQYMFRGQRSKLVANWRIWLR